MDSFQNPMYGPPQPTKRAIPWGPLLNVIATAIAAGALKWFSQTAGIHPVFKWFMASLLILTLLWISRDFWQGALREAKRFVGDKLFLREQSAELERLETKFFAFTRRDSTVGFPGILLDSTNRDYSEFSKVIPCDFVEAWLNCFRLRRKIVKERTIQEFKVRSGEFMTIVQAFNRDYVLRAQRELTKFKSPGKDRLDQLEQFREDFHAFLREMENWNTEISRYFQNHPGGRLMLQWPAPSNYERVPSFLRSESAANE